LEFHSTEELREKFGGENYFAKVPSVASFRTTLQTKEDTNNQTYMKSWKEMNLGEEALGKPLF
jgi:hypothetical protein